MNLDIEIIDTSIDVDIFVNTYLTRIIRKYVVLNFNPDKVKPFEEYINKNLNLDCSAEEIISYALDTLYVSKHGSFYKIMINPSATIPKTAIKLKSVIQLLESGNLEIRGYPIITNAMSNVKNNIRQLIASFKVITRKGVL